MFDRNKVGGYVGLLEFLGLADRWKFGCKKICAQFYLAPS